MLTIFYSPHATSLDNERGLASGHADVPLSALGIQQAQELGRHYATLDVNGVFCSDLQRALNTARLAFAERGLPIVTDNRLREYDYGDWTQYPKAQVEAEFIRRIMEPFPHGESLHTVVQRVGSFLRDVLPKYEGKTIVVIGHRATRYALEYWCGDGSLEEIVGASASWREVPVWRYELTAQHLEQRSTIR